MTPTAWRAGREKVEVSAIIREVRAASIKIADGTTREWQDKHTGGLVEREVWHFLPRSQIEIEGASMDDIEDFLDKTVTLLMPRWLAEEKGLV